MFRHFKSEVFSEFRGHIAVTALRSLRPTLDSRPVTKSLRRCSDNGEIDTWIAVTALRLSAAYIKSLPKSLTAFRFRPIELVKHYENESGYHQRDFFVLQCRRRVNHRFEQELLPTSPLFQTSLASGQFFRCRIQTLSA
jgi:hypothetical protein